MTSLQEKRADRLRFLHAVYEIVEDRRDLSISSWELADEIEMDRVRSSYIVDYLVAEGLLQRTHGNGGIGITHEGIKEVEAALLKPEEETTYFPPAMNIIHIGTNIGSPILQGGEGNTQIVSKDEVAELREILQTLQEPELLAALPEAERKEALASAIYYMPYFLPEEVLAGYREINETIRTVGTERAGVVLVEGEDAIPADDAHFADTVHFLDPGAVLQAERITQALLADPAFQALCEANRGS